MGRFVVGDLHGELGMLESVLSQAGFSPSRDILYSTGDIADRGPEILETIRFLQNLGSSYLPVLGNHDVWLQNYLYDGRVLTHWLRNGGEDTIVALAPLTEEEKGEMCRWLLDVPYCRVLEDVVIVHGGLVPGLHTLPYLEALGKSPRTLPEEDGDIGLHRKDTTPHPVVELLWDRTLLRAAASSMMDGGTTSKTVDLGGRLLVVGHTPLRILFHSEEQNLICVDTGSCYEGGHVALFSLDERVYWRSDRSGALALGNGNRHYEEHP